MKDIFQFKILIHENLSDTFIIEKFIVFLEERLVYWGGGGSDNQINGSLYTDENVMITINDFIKEFVTFFINLKIEISKIEINIEYGYSHSFV
ncbi:hypothetical protein WH221_18440 [Chryseobacterium culicis]|uniref:Uncharacterized protein n=1 Tax=Chryseobacterium culicis TaxID=680127 RepID=A0A2S9CMB1_CHRCI|nr:hypothetical protein [Chryseobacterium culicis]PRB81652.1 hypothetical protein CQ022_18395 [Chryseobacterium culicis]PRB88307.1 hypothetical protein CQ033_17290 [Chryseobacterium culicis]